MLGGCREEIHWQISVEGTSLNCPPFPSVNIGEYNCLVIIHIVTGFFLLLIHSGTERWMDACNTLNSVCQPTGFYRISRLWCLFGVLFCILTEVRTLAPSFLLCLAVKIENCPHLEKEMPYALRGNCCKSVLSVDSCIDSGVWISFLVSFLDATLALSP